MEFHTVLYRAALLASGATHNIGKGTLTIDGKSDAFDRFGVSTASPPERKQPLYTVQAFRSLAEKRKVSIFEQAKVNGKSIFSVIVAGDARKNSQREDARGGRILPPLVFCRFQQIRVC